jgi:hypothetical protein
VLLVFGAPCQLKTLAGQEHGRTIPLPDMPVRLARVRFFSIRRNCHAACMSRLLEELGMEVIF